jgi:hypothetical protein
MSMMPISLSALFTRCMLPSESSHCAALPLWVAAARAIVEMQPERTRQWTVERRAD